MFGFTMLSATVLALISVSAAAPTPDASTSTLTPIDFDGKTVYINTLDLVSDISPVSRREPQLSARATPTGDNCGQSSFYPEDPLPAYARVDDCNVIVNFLSSLPPGQYWTIQHPQDYVTLGSFNTCKVYIFPNSGTDTYIGTTDIRDVMRDGINLFQSGGNIGAHGNMNCLNADGANSFVYWDIARA